MNLDEYYLLINGETYGPFSFEQLHELWQREELPLDTFFVRKGMKEVLPLNKIVNRIIAFRKPEPPPAPAPETEPEASSQRRVLLKLVVVVGLFMAAGYALLTALKVIFSDP